MQNHSYRSFVVVLVLALLGVWLVLAELANAREFNFYCNDDAYISFTYARNLIQGHGLVFNPGEYVEGYTNFLWLIFLVPWMKLFPGTDVSLIAIFWGVFFSLAVLVLTYRIGYKLQGGHAWTNLIAPFLLSLDNSFHYWPVSGLEVSLQTVLLLSACLFLFRMTPRGFLFAGILFALATMARPDSGLFWAVSTGSLALWALRSRSNDAGWRGLLYLGAGFLTVLVPYCLWKISYYGDVLPNTFYLHTGNRLLRMKNGLSYLNRFLENRYYLPLLCLIAPALRFSFQRMVLLLSVLGFSVYAVWIGGDFFPGSRFYCVVLPFVYVLFQDLVAQLSARFSEKLHPAVLAGAFSIAAGFCVFHGSYGPSGEFRHFVLVWAEDDFKRIQFAKDLARIAKDGDSILAGPIGQIGYYSGLRVLDYWGVIDPHIARLRNNETGGGVPGHEKSDLAYLMKKKPTYVVFGYDNLHPPEGYSIREFRVEDRRWRVLKRNSP